jgi:exonuclease SbcC
MIPRKITIKNFLSYQATQTITFDPHKIICLTGKNGHGKSALLDAMTWAIWGQARKLTHTGKHDDALLHLGHTSMFCELDIHCNGNEYRIHREYSTGPKSGTKLNIVSINQNTQSLRPLTEKTIRETQVIINNIIGLDYDTFINSVFLRQGNANEFSKKTPGERKEILTNILGLDRYETTRQAALALTKPLKQQQETYIQQRDTINKILEQQTTILHELTTLQDILANLEASLETLQQQYQQQLQKRALVNEHNQKYMLINTTYQTLLHTMQQTWNQYQQQRQSLQVLRKQLIPNTQKPSELLNQITALQNDLTTTQELINQEKQLHQHVINYQNTYTQNYQHHHILLTQQITHITEKYTAIHQKLQEYHQKNQTYHDELITINQQSRTNNVHNITQLPDVLEKIKHYYQLWHTRWASLDQYLKTTPISKNSHELTTCSRCQQPISHELHAILLQQEQNHLNLCKHQYKRLTQLLPIIKKRAHEYHLLKSYYERYQLITHDLQAITQEISQKDQESKKIKQELDSIIQEKKAHELTEQLTESNQPYGQLLQQFNRVHNQRIKQEQLTYQHTHRIQKLQSLYKTLEAQQALETKKIQLLTTLQTILVTLRQTKTTLLKTGNERDGLPKPQDLIDINNTITQLEKTLHHNNQEKHVLAIQLGTLQEQVKQHHELEKNRQELENKLSTINQDIYDYTAIANSLSKDGIQALLIEEAIPAIEHEANHLLSLLTNNQAQLHIESLRDLKSGKSKETLEITISDELGIRPYELFSGGEAFRIDFALRIALSKLLAHRSGTTLQTLIIDEGFGSQDEEGITRIIQALESIQNEFARIIIVSHLPILKEQLPIQFYVHKGSQGSIIQIVDQD